MSDRIINTLLVLASIIWVVIFAYALTNYDAPYFTITKAIVFYAVPLAAAAACLACLRLSRAARAAVLVSGLAAVIAVYGAQAYMIWQPAQAREAKLIRMAEKLGKTYDPRTRDEVAWDMRKQGVNAYPMIFPTDVMQSPVRSADIQPLAGVPGKLTVLCNETGEFLTYRSDRHGFLNPDSVWDRNSFDLALVGDSFTHGACVPVNANLASRIRERYPATVNLGIGHRGPLLELATFLEYAPYLKPKVTLWFFYGMNDFVNLASWRHEPLLTRYLKSDFRQRLFERRDEVERYLTFYVDEYLAKSKFELPLATRIANIVLLRPLRDRLKINLTGIIDIPETIGEMNALLPEIREIMAKAKTTAAQWGGSVLFVYLPSMNLFLKDEDGRKEAEVKKSLFAEIRGLAIPVVDVTDDFRKYDKPAERFWRYPGSHYNEEGYRVVAAAAMAALPDTPGLETKETNK